MWIYSTLPPQNISSKKTLAHGASQGEELCHWPDGHKAAQTLYAGIWPGGERKRLCQLLNSLHPSPKQATHTSAVTHKHHALGESTKVTSDDTWPVHPDLERCLKCSQLPGETTSLTKQGLAVNQLSKFYFFKSICTSRTCTHMTTGCSSLPNKHLLKSCIYYTHCNPIKGLRSHQQWASLDFPYVLKGGSPRGWTAFCGLPWKEKETFHLSCSEVSADIAQRNLFSLLTWNMPSRVYFSPAATKTAQGD